MQHAALGRLVEGRRDRSEGRGRLVFVPRRHQGEVCFLQRLEARLDALVVEVPARAVTQAAFGGLGIRHKINFLQN